MEVGFVCFLIAGYLQSQKRVRAETFLDLFSWVFQYLFQPISFTYCLNLDKSLCPSAPCFSSPFCPMFRLVSSLKLGLPLPLCFLGQKTERAKRVQNRFLNTVKQGCFL